ncbi:uncharacterized protein LOC134796857 [Cydia splendana]|uniref:uncharacterized protein LOC134796857 n=1 Tax=Cydia splendana TaxID=1100963 RepID=UPI002128AED5
METRSLALLALCVVYAEPLSGANDAPEPLRPLQQVLKTRSDAFDPYANEYIQDYEPVAFAAVPLGSPVPIIAVLSENPLEQAKQLEKAVATSLKQAYAKPDYQQNFIPSDPTEYPSYYTKPYEEYQKPYEHLKSKPYMPQEYPKYYSSIEFAKQFPTMEYAKPYPPVEYIKPAPPVEYTKPYPVEYVKPYPVEYPKPYTVEYPYRAAEYTKPYQEEYVRERPYREEYVRERPTATEEKPTILYARPNGNGGYTYSRRPLKKRNVKRPQKQKPMIIRVHKYRVIRSRRSEPDINL